MSQTQLTPDISNGKQLSLTGYHLTKAFYAEVEQNEAMQLKATAHHHSLYTWICELRNRVKREILALPVKYTMQMAFIGSDKTLKNCIDDLESWGIIEVLQRGSNQHVSTKIKLAVAFLRKNCDNDAKSDDYAVAFLRERYDSSTIAVRTTKTSKNSKKGETTIASSVVPTFDTFWDAYDKKLGKLKSEKSWGKLTDQDKIDIMAVLPAYVLATSGDRYQYRMHPATFLNNQSWKDEDIGKAQTRSAQQTTNKPTSAPRPVHQTDIR